MNKFINKCLKIHGDKYDYSLSVYVNAHIKIKIICKTCGNIFEQTPNSHLNGHGCSECKKINNRNKFRDTKEIFIEKSNKVHNYSFDYSLTDYFNALIPVKIICKTCNFIFEQTPNNHITKKQGCPECYYESNRLNKEELILKLNKIHNNFYDYSLIGEFKNINEKVKIICPIHESFQQKLQSHIDGHGCPECNHKKSKGEKQIKCYLEENNIKYKEQIKFKDCLNIKHLSFDFYLSDHNICIEFDGEQHYKIVEYFGGEKEYQKRILRDKIKNEYCLNNNIHLLRIRFDENIEDILDYSILKYK